MTIEDARTKYKSMMHTLDVMSVGGEARRYMAKFGRGHKPGEYIRRLQGFRAKCPHCDGSGTYGEHGTCYRCNGAGTVGLSDSARYKAYLAHRRGNA